MNLQDHDIISQKAPLRRLEGQEKQRDDSNRESYGNNQHESHPEKKKKKKKRRLNIDKLLMLMHPEQLVQVFQANANVEPVLADQETFVQALSELGIKVKDSALFWKKYSTTSGHTMDRREFRMAVQSEGDNIDRTCSDHHAGEGMIDAAFDRHAKQCKYMNKSAFKRTLKEMEIVHSKSEIPALVMEIYHDWDRNTLMDEHDFLMAIKQRSELEKILVGLPLVVALGRSLCQQAQSHLNHHQQPRSSSEAAVSPVESFIGMSDDEIDHAVQHSVPALSAILKETLHKLQMAMAEEERKKVNSPDKSNAGEKYCFDICGGNLDDFNQSLANRIGVADLNVSAGMKREHVDSAGANEVFTTSNYNITTTAKIEYNLAISGGKYYVKMAAECQRNPSILIELSPEEQRLVAEGGVPRSGTGPDRRILELSKCMDLEVVQHAGLTKDEIIAVIMYTGPMYKKWNTALRNGQDVFPTSLHVLSSAVKKVQQSGYRLRPGMVLYRGLSGGKLPKRVFVPTKENRNEIGLTEYGIQSTTTDLRVALQYSGIQQGFTSTVLEAKIGQVDSAAFLAELSQYPQEREYVYPPGSYIQAEDNVRMELTEKGLVKVVPVRINTNGRTMTVKEVISQRRNNVEHTFELVKREIQQDLKKYMYDPAVLDRIERDEMNCFRVNEKCAKVNWGEESKSPSFHNSGLIQLTLQSWLPDWRLSHIEVHDDGWFNSDCNYKNLLKEVIDLKRQALWTILFFKEDMERVSWRESLKEPRAYSLEIMDVNRMEQLRSSLAALKKVKETATSEDNRACLEIRQIARSLCQREGYLVHSIDEKLNEVSRETPLIHACTTANEELVHLLIDAGVSADESDATGMTAFLRACRSGHLSIARLLVEEGGVDENIRGYEGATALLLASQHGHDEVARFLVQECHADVEEQNSKGETALLLAAAAGENRVVEYLIQEGKASTETMDALGYTPLIFAAQQGHDLVVKSLIQCGASVNAKRNDKVTALMLATQMGYLPIVKLLVESGADANSQRNDGMTSLMLAALNARFHIAKYLTEQGHAAVNATNTNGWTALMYATQSDCLEVAKLLIDQDADVDTKGNGGESAIMLARSNGNNQIVDLILSKSLGGMEVPPDPGLANLMFAIHMAARHTDDERFIVPADEARANDLLRAAAEGDHSTVISCCEDVEDVDAADENGATALVLAALHGHESIVNALIQKGAAVDKPRNDGRTALMCAVECSHYSIMECLVRDGTVCANHPDNTGTTALMIAARQGQLDSVAFLVESARAKVDMQNSQGEAALFIAAFNGKSSVVEYLVRSGGADVGLPDEEGRTALMGAALAGSLKLVEFLVKVGHAEVDAQTSDGTTALVYAAKNNCQSVVEFLINADANVDLVSSTFGTALMAAAIEDHDRVISLLVREGHANVNLADMDDDNLTALILASSAGSLSAVKCLVEEGSAVVGAKDSGGRTALMYAVAKEHLDVAKYLVDTAHASLEEVTDDGETLLILAVKADAIDTETVEWLVRDCCADVDAVEDDQWSALGFALVREDYDVARLLVREGGAKVNVELSDGLTPLMIAVERGNVDMVRFLLEEGNADPTIGAINDNTCIMMAAREGKQSIVEMIVDDQKRKGKTTLDENDLAAMHLAVQNGHYEVARLVASQDEDDGDMAMQLIASHAPRLSPGIRKNDDSFDENNRENWTSLKRCY